MALKSCQALFESSILKIDLPSCATQAKELWDRMEALKDSSYVVGKGF
jgi:hypothetical protein